MRHEGQGMVPSQSTGENDMLYFAFYQKDDEAQPHGFYQEQSKKFNTFDEAKSWLKTKADEAGKNFRSGHVEGWLEDNELEEGEWMHRVYLHDGSYGSLRDFLRA